MHPIITIIVLTALCMAFLLGIAALLTELQKTQEILRQWKTLFLDTRSREAINQNKFGPYLDNSEYVGFKEAVQHTFEETVKLLNN